MRPWRESDAPILYKWASDPDVGPRAGWTPHKSVEESLQVIRTLFSDTTNTWAIELKENHQAIGSISLMNVDDEKECGEIGYCIGRRYWNQGIVTEAFQALIPFCLNEIGIERLVARHDVNNPASGRVMQKCFLTYEGTLRKVEKNSQGEFIDCCYYSILKDEYPCSK